MKSLTTETILQILPFDKQVELCKTLNETLNKNTRLENVYTVVLNGQCPTGGDWSYDLFVNSLSVVMMKHK